MGRGAVAPWRILSFPGRAWERLKVGRADCQPALIKCGIAQKPGFLKKPGFSYLTKDEKRYI
jgi:hypothetical protein